MPNKTLRQFSTAFTNDTNWDICASSVIADNIQDLVSFSANLAEPPGLGFYVIAETPSGVKMRRVGSTQDAFKEKSLKNVLNCTVYATLSMTISTIIGTNEVPHPDSSRAKIKMCIVGVESYGISKVKPIQFSRGKKDRFMK
jgi:hypothetical protein